MFRGSKLVHPYNLSNSRTCTPFQRKWRWSAWPWNYPRFTLDLAGHRDWLM